MTLHCKPSGARERRLAHQEAAQQSQLERQNPGGTETRVLFTTGARDRRLAHQEAARQSQRTRAEPHPSQNLAVQRVMAQSGGQVCWARFGGFGAEWCVGFVAELVHTCTVGLAVQSVCRAADKCTLVPRWQQGRAVSACLCRAHVQRQHYFANADCLGKLATGPAPAVCQLCSKAPQGTSDVCPYTVSDSFFGAGAAAGSAADRGGLADGRPRRRPHGLPRHGARRAFGVSGSRGWHACSVWCFPARRPCAGHVLLLPPESLAPRMLLPDRLHVVSSAHCPLVLVHATSWQPASWSAARLAVCCAMGW